MRTISAEGLEQTPDPRDEGKAWAGSLGYICHVLHSEGYVRHVLHSETDEGKQEGS